MSFSQFWAAYEDMVRKARNNPLTAEDFAGVTISLTNPGTIGTNHSVPRLTMGQGTIVGIGAMEYPAEFQGASEEKLADNGISKIITLTSTYDHRIIQGAESGDFLRRIHPLVLGEEDFYDDIFASLRIPYEPIRWRQDLPAASIDRTARILELIDAYRTRGHLMADTDPLTHPQRKHPDLDIAYHELTLWDLDREFPVDGFAGREQHEAARRPRRPARLLLPHHRHRVHAHPRPREARLAPGAHRGAARAGAGRRAEVHPVQAQRRRGVRGVPADQVRRAEALLARGRRDGHPAARRGARHGRRARDGRGRHRHAPPRAPQRAGQHRRQARLAESSASSRATSTPARPTARAT